MSSGGDPSSTASPGVPDREPASGAGASSALDVQTAFARTLVDEWARGGLRHACLAPGSRSTPLVLALDRDDRITLHVCIDERSAAFLALGIGRAGGAPALVLSTSGSAPTHFHPAVVEAYHGRVPLLVVTANRPPELRDTGASQTIDQTGLYGGAPRWSVALGPADLSAVEAALHAERAGSGIGALGGHWRSVACRALLEAHGPPAGPVHMDLALREPLVPTGGPVPEVPGTAGGHPWVVPFPRRSAPDDAVVAAVAHAVARHPRGLLVAGWGSGVHPETAARFAARSGWPVLADPLSGLRGGPDAVSTYEALLRVPGVADVLRPDLVLRVGASLTSRTATQWLDTRVGQYVVDPDRAWLDPERAATRRLEVDADLLLGAVADHLPAGRDDGRPGPWAAAWAGAEEVARTAIDGLLDGWDVPTEPRIARDVVAALPDGATLFVASSMPVRDVEWFAAPRRGLRVLANRGTNGIDGFVSTVLGVAVSSGGQPVVGLGGDLAFLHDTNGLLGAAGRRVDVTFVVVDNDGGGIFSFLPQAEPGVTDRFEALFATPHGVDLTALAAVHGIPGTAVDRADELGPALAASVARGGMHLLHVRTDRADNVARHRAVWDAVAHGVGPLLAGSAATLAVPRGPAGR